MNVLELFHRNLGCASSNYVKSGSKFNKIVYDSDLANKKIKQNSSDITVSSCLVGIVKRSVDKRCVSNVVKQRLSEIVPTDF